LPNKTRILIIPFSQKLLFAKFEIFELTVHVALVFVLDKGVSSRFFALAILDQINLLKYKSIAQGRCNKHRESCKNPRTNSFVRSFFSKDENSQIKKILDEKFHRIYNFLQACYRLGLNPTYFLNLTVSFEFTT